jgi:hypothetical protein
MSRVLISDVKVEFIYFIRVMYANKIMHCTKSWGYMSLNGHVILRGMCQDHETLLYNTEDLFNSISCRRMIKIVQFFSIDRPVGSLSVLLDHYWPIASTKPT